ncbi:MAG TPA: hypothetical protein VGS01_06485 [Candidatus Limnocylindria bacterium]|nr:hypothetical protein [Candidatus Limnocylindria bacterium]
MHAPEWVSWWLAGATLSAVLLGLALRTSAVALVGILALALVALRSPERGAVGGGAIVVSGAGFLYSVRQAVERCAEFDRVSRPNGGCTVYGVEDQVIAMGLYLLVGIGLTVYAAFRSRAVAPRPSSSPPRA